MSVQARPSAIRQVGAVCMSCVRGARSFTGRYREFLLAPGTLFTFGSLLLLILAAVMNPGGPHRPRGGLSGANALLPRGRLGRLGLHLVVGDPGHQSA
jgi:hypothetical protein